MHLNALYREAQAGKASLVECVHALTAARRRDGVVLRPLRYWTVRRARHHFDRARHHLEVVRRHIRGAAQIGPQATIDSSGGYAIGGLLGGGMLDQLVTTTIDSTVAGALDGSLTEVRGLLSEVDQLLLRMRKAGAVG